jgi:proteasome lid subunit RPN8/RPN11
MGKRVVMGAPVRVAIAAAARASAPGEACGALLGSSDFAQHWEVSSVCVLRNEAADPYHEFLISSNTVRELEKTAGAMDTELIGFFHSHPHGSEPSSTDLERAWPGYVYVIADASANGSLRGWTLNDDRAAFSAVPVESA